MPLLATVRLMNLEVLGPSFAIGVSQAGLYGLLAVALVLTFRVSRTVAFVHGGIAVVGALGYWVLTYPPRSVIPGYRPGLDGILALVIVAGAGTAIGAGYGAVVLGRKMANLARVTLTIFSLGIMLILMGIMSEFFYVAPDALPPSPFGDARYRMFDFYVTAHRAITVVIVTLVVIGLGLALTRTRSGLEVRAIADDVEASQWAGVRLRRLGTVVYAASGAIAGIAGALVTPIVGPDPVEVFFVFLRALSVAVMGGFNSVTVALAGSVVLGVVDSSLRTGLVDGVTMGQREMIIMAVVFLVVATIARRRPVLDLVDEAI